MFTWLFLAFVTLPPWSTESSMWKCCFLKCCSDETPRLEQWHDEMKHAIEHASFLDQDFCRSLLFEGDDSAIDKEKQLEWLLGDSIASHESDKIVVLKGLPQRPFYKELANRLALCSAQEVSDEKNLLSLSGPCSPRTPHLVPAADMGMSETIRKLPSSLPSTPMSVFKWLKEVREDGIMYMLGMRQTIGTLSDSYLLPPKQKDLLDAACRIHRPCSKSMLTVAARARAKHAHRGSRDQFFGVVKGGEKEQNVESFRLVQKLLKEAVWINIHTFGGLDGTPVLEVRILSGYGARWKADWFSNRVQPSDVEFRGFLEPQMASGHELKWRH